MSEEKYLGDVPEKYAEQWLVLAIEKVKENLHNPDDVASVLEIAFADGYRTGHAHASKKPKQPGGEE